jgi:hypothetical protein
MAMRLGGVFLILMGAVLAALGAALALVLLGRPLPGIPGLSALQSFFDQLADAAAVPDGSAWDVLTGSTSGKMALAGLAGGAALILGGLWQTVTGRRSATILTVVMALVCGFAVAMVMAG